VSSTATDHLWRHFTRTVDEQIVVVRGEGCYIWDSEGNRYLDALSALYCVNIGYGPWPEIAEAAAKQLEELPFFTNWVGFATPPSLELAEKLSDLVPIDVGRIFFVGGGSEAIETALKVARQYHRLRGEPARYKFISRRSAYHGTTFGALSINGSPALRAQFEPLLPGCIRAPLPYRYRCPYCSEEPRCTLRCADEIDLIIRNEGPEKVICGFGRVGDWFGSTRYGIEPDLMTMAKGITSAYAPLGAVVASERVTEPFFSEPKTSLLHGITFGGHPLSCAIALANLEIFEREDLIGHVQRNMDDLRGRCEELLLEHPLVGDLRGDGFFYSLELVKDKETKETFTPAERDELIKGFLVPRTRELGVYMRFDDRGETCAQFAPPLVAGPAEFEEMVGVLRQVLDETRDRINTKVGA
jgi:adenosylmethionine-8-amino-7-oxononanoate aminotransferase